jgi:hypothetical protein
MKNFSLLLILLWAVSILQFGCDSTGPDNETDIAYLELYWNNQVYYSETLTESDDGESEEIILPDDSVVYLQKYVLLMYNPILLDDQNSFKCLAVKTGYYSQYKNCAKEDTIRIYTDSGFTPVEAEKVCGLIYNKYTGTMRNYELVILNKSDSTFVTNVYTNADGHYAIELVLGEYLIKWNAFTYEIIDFTITSYYKDAMFIEYIEFP